MPADLRSKRRGKPGSARVLVVDDDPQMLGYVQRLLQEARLQPQRSGHTGTPNSHGGRNIASPGSLAGQDGKRLNSTVYDYTFLLATLLQRAGVPEGVEYGSYQ